MPTAQRSFAGDAASVGEARRFLRRTLTDWGVEVLEGPATAVLSELATNSVLHTHGGFAVTVTWDGALLRLGISDGSVQAPRRRPHSAESTTGRGLTMVGALSQAWGVDTRRDGKTVWAELSAGAKQGRDDQSGAAELLGLFPALEGPEPKPGRRGTGPRALVRAA